MSAKGKSGMIIHLDKVPTRQKGMKAWELLLSESQERMLLVVEKGKEQAVIDVFEKWDLPCSHIGDVTDDGMLRFYMNEVEEAVIPADELVLGGGAPQYERNFTKPKYLSKIEAFNQETITVPDDIMAVAKQLVAIPNIASKKWIFDQYDSMVGTGTTNTNKPSDAAVVIAKPTNKALALTTDCNSRYVFADPYKGAMIAVAEAARNIVCSGGQPLGVTNCLNFGNPYDPEVYYQFTEAIKGMGAACVKFDTPVTGGNVSFYNQSPDGPVYPTPTIGMVGLLDSVADKMTMYFKEAGDSIFIIGHIKNDIGSSEYLHKIVGEEFSSAPYFNLDEEYDMQQLVLKLIENKAIVSAHDISEGGLIVTLLESSFNKNLGFSVSQENLEIRKDAFWFGEAQGRVVVSVNEKMKVDFEKLINQSNVPVTKIGNVNEGSVNVDSQTWGSVDEWKMVYDNAIATLLKGEVN
jgi:phosphoribosylformylglycinamidine synthase